MEFIKTISLPGTLTACLGLALYQTYRNEKLNPSLSTKILLVILRSIRNLLFLAFIFSSFLTKSLWTDLTTFEYINEANALSTTCFTLALEIFFFVPFLYFYNQNKTLIKTGPEIYNKKFANALTLTFYVLLTISALFTLISVVTLGKTDFGQTASSLGEKFFYFIVSLCILTLFSFGALLTIKPFFCSPIEKFKAAAKMEFVAGVFNESAIMKEIESTNEELQYFLEKYSMTGNTIPRNERKKYESLKKQRNLLLHRSNLTSQFVTRSAKLKNFLARSWVMLKSSAVIFVSLLFYLTVFFSVLNILFPNERIFAHTPLMLNPMSSGFDAFMAEGKNALWITKDLPFIVSKTITIILLIFICTSSETFEDKENLKRIKKCMGKSEAIDEIQQAMIDNQCLSNALKKISVFCFFSIVFLIAAPQKQIYLDQEKCDLLLQTPQMLGWPLPSECNLTAVGHLYNYLVIRPEFKIVIFLSITSYTLVATFELLTSLFLPRKFSGKE